MYLCYKILLFCHKTLLLELKRKSQVTYSIREVFLEQEVGLNDSLFRDI